MKLVFNRTSEVLRGSLLVLSITTGLLKVGIMYYINLPICYTRNRRGGKLPNSLVRSFPAPTKATTDADEEHD